MANLEKCIERLSIGGAGQFADCFSHFLDLQLSFFCNNPNDRQKALFAHMRGDPSFRNDMADAMRAFADEAEGFRDPLGDMFMNRISHGEKGQFFTPDDLSALMTTLTGLFDGARVNDPACGSGRMLLQALKTARGKGWDIELYATDVSMTCAKMALLNFVVNTAGGEVSCGSSLSLDYENFTFFKIDRVKNVETGALLSTYWEYTAANAGKVREERDAWFLGLAMKGWVPYRTRRDDGTRKMAGDAAAQAQAPAHASPGTQLELF